MTVSSLHLKSKNTFIMKLEFIKAIDWIVYIISLALAIYYIIASGVIQNYANKTTDSFKSEVEADHADVPEFYFCDASKRILSLKHADFEIDYKVTDNGVILNQIEGIKTRSMLGQCVIVYFPTELKFSYNLVHKILIKFNSTIEKDLRLTGYISKKDNLPILDVHSHDGHPMTIPLDPKQKAAITIQEERSKYLPSNCREKPLLEFLLSQFNNSGMNCSVKCLPRWDLPPEYLNVMKMYPTCGKSLKLNHCAAKWFSITVKNMKNLCHSVSYSGRYDVSSIPDYQDWCSKVSLFIL